MNNDLNVTQTETVQSIPVYSMVQYGQLFKSEQDIQDLEYDENVILKFMN